MKKIVEFPVSVGEKVIYVSSEDFPFEPNMEELYVINYSYNRCHDEFCIIVDSNFDNAYGAEIYLRRFNIDAFLIEDKDKAEKIFNERLMKWKEKNKLNN